MKIIAIILLLIYQFGTLIMVSNLKGNYEKDLRNKISFVGYLIPIAMCIILAM